jgi:RNA polymerase sigma factor (TIGR02999 family)
MPINFLFADFDMSASQEVTLLLKEISAGDGQAPDKLLPLVYGELRKLAHSYLQNERREHTLQATALVHEAYIRLVDWENVSWQNRAHFFAVAAQVMRKILVDYARQKKAQKRDFGQKLALDETISFSAPKGLDLILLDEALESLKEFDRTQAEIVELRFFGGLTIEETAQALSISPATVKREWTMAKAWLYHRMKDE